MSKGIKISNTNFLKIDDERVYFEEVVEQDKEYAEVRVGFCDRYAQELPSKQHHLYFVNDEILTIETKDEDDRVQTLAYASFLKEAETRIERLKDGKTLIFRKPYKISHEYSQSRLEHRMSGPFVAAVIKKDGEVLMLDPRMVTVEAIIDDKMLITGPFQRRGGSAYERGTGTYTVDLKTFEIKKFPIDLHLYGNSRNRDMRYAIVFKDGTIGFPRYGLFDIDGNVIDPNFDVRETRRFTFSISNNQTGQIVEMAGAPTPYEITYVLNTPDNRLNAPLAKTRALPSAVKGCFLTKGDIHIAKNLMLLGEKEIGVTLIDTKANTLYIHNNSIYEPTNYMVEGRPEDQDFQITQTIKKPGIDEAVLSRLNPSPAAKLSTLNIANAQGVPMFQVYLEEIDGDERSLGVSQISKQITGTDGKATLAMYQTWLYGISTNKGDLTLLAKVEDDHTEALCIVSTLDGKQDELFEVNETYVVNFDKWLPNQQGFAYNLKGELLGKSEIGFEISGVGETEGIKLFAIRHHTSMLNGAILSNGTPLVSAKYKTIDGALKAGKKAISQNLPAVQKALAKSTDAGVIEDATQTELENEELTWNSLGFGD